MKEEQSHTYAYHLLGGCESTSAMECLLELAMEEDEVAENAPVLCQQYYQLKRYLASIENNQTSMPHASMQIELTAPQLSGLANKKI